MNNKAKDGKKFSTIISDINIQNLKSFKYTSLSCKPINLFIGENGTGKSSILEVIGIFLQSEFSFVKSGSLVKWENLEDVFHNHDFSKNVSLSLSFSFPLKAMLDPFQEEQEIFSNYTTELCIEKAEQDASENVFNVDQITYFSNGEDEEMEAWRHYFHRSIRKRGGSSAERETELENVFREIQHLPIFSNYKQRGITTLKDSSGFWSFNYDMSFSRINADAVYRRDHIELLSNFPNMTKVEEKVQTNFYPLVKREMPASLRFVFDMNKMKPYIDFIPSNRMIEASKFNFNPTPSEMISLFDKGRSIAQNLVFPSEETERIFNIMNMWLEKFDLGNFAVILEKGSPEGNTAKLRLKVLDKKSNTIQDVSILGSGMKQLVGFIFVCITAKKGGILLIEEPEIHLHPKTQAKVMNLLVETASRGVQLFITTHSEYLLLRLQRLIAEKEIGSKDVAVYEFQRDEDTKANPVRIDEQGYFEEGMPSFLDHSRTEFRELEKAHKKQEE